MQLVEATIPETKQTAADFTVYVVRVVHPKGTKVVEKRYSEFFELHKKLRKENVRPYPEFPSKRLVRKRDPKVVEARRQQLEAYLEEFLAQEKIPRLVLSFLGVDLDEGENDGQEESDWFEQSRRMAHHTSALCIDWDVVNARAVQDLDAPSLEQLYAVAEGRAATQAIVSGLQDSALSGLLMTLYGSESVRFGGAA